MCSPLLTGSAFCRRTSQLTFNGGFPIFQIDRNDLLRRRAFLQMSLFGFFVIKYWQTHCCLFSLFISPGSYHSPGNLQWAADLWPGYCVPAEKWWGGTFSWVKFGWPGENVFTQPVDDSLTWVTLFFQQPPTTRQQLHWSASCRYISKRLD